MTNAMHNWNTGRVKSNAWTRGSDVGRRFFLSQWTSLVIAACCVLLFLTGSTELSQEHRVKAAFLYNFAKFIDWPNDQTKSTILFCIVGEDPLGVAMKTIAGKIVRGRVISVQQISMQDTASDCQMLFVSGFDALPGKQTVDRMTNQGIVTVGEGEQFVHYGGMIGFTTKRQESTSDKIRVGFAINMDTARRAGVQISSELLKLATAVEGVR